MSITKPLVFQAVGVGGGSGTGVVQYPLMVTDSASIAITPVMDTLDNNQQLPSAFDVTAEVISFNSTLLNDTNVYSNTAATPVLASLCFIGATGSQTINVLNVYVTAHRVFDGNRTGIKLVAQKRATNADLITTTT